MYKDTLAQFDIVLASASPRRQELLKLMGIPFRIEVKPIDETYPSDLQDVEITDFLAKSKAEAFGALNKNQMVICSDTIVWHRNQALGKPENLEEAKALLQQISGEMHSVYTSVCIRCNDKTHIINDVTKVFFAKLTASEMDYYVQTYRPLDKAGAYGIQEWIGIIGVQRIEGSYHNVMGLPTQKLHQFFTNLSNEL